MNSAKKGLGNILTNFISEAVTVLLGIIIPRLVLVNLGSEANGLLTSITNILRYVALLEAGVGTAALQSLYGPAAKDDRDSIRSILAATDRFYRRTGFVYAAVVLLLTFVFPFTIRSELPKTEIMGVLFLSGIPGVITYFFQGKFTIFLKAEGKNYVLTLLTTLTLILTSIGKIILLVLGFNLVALQLITLLFNIAQVIFIMSYMKRHYPWLELDVKPDYDAISKSKNALVHQVATLIFFNMDVLILTYFCGLKTASVYSMYATMFGIVSLMITNFNGVDFILGQSFNTDRERYLKLQDTFEIYNMALTFSLFCVAGIFILPFMKLYTAGVTDINYIDKYLPYLMISTYLMSNGRAASSQAIDFAQHFKQTQGRAILESCINLVFSLVGVYYLGIYGVLIGTAAALLYRTNDMILYASRRILHRSPWITYRRWLLNLALFILFSVGAKALFAHIALDSYVSIVLWAAASCIVIVPLFFLIVSLFDRETFRFARELLTPYVRALRNRLRG